MKTTILALVAATFVTAQKGKQNAKAQDALPATGDGTVAGGIFSIPLSQLARESSKSPKLFGDGIGAESPRAKSNAVTGGTGPYPAKWLVDPSIPNHVVYAPISPPAGIQLPVVTWGNGACRTNGTGFTNFLTNLASYGYLVVANGSPEGLGRQSKVSDVRESIDWALKGGGANYGTIDTTKIAAAGQSCGGLEAYSVSYRDPRIKLTLLFNIGIFNDNQRYLLKELKAPVAYFLGGNNDVGYPNGQKDYSLLPQGLPAFLANLDAGHYGTLFATDGGKFGQAAVAYLEWKFRDDAKSKEVAIGKGPGSLTSQSWQVTFKNQS